MHSNNVSPFHVDLDGSQIVRNIRLTYDRLSAALAGHAAIEVHCQVIAECDLSLIQVLLAAKRSADNNGKFMRLASPADGILRNALDRAGFLAAHGDGTNNDREFWLNGAPAK